MRPTVRTFTVPSQRAPTLRLQNTRTRSWLANGPWPTARTSRSTRSSRRAPAEVVSGLPVAALRCTPTARTVVVPVAPVGPVAPVEPAEPGDPVDPVEP